jgi:hypothetical protein
MVQPVQTNKEVYIAYGFGALVDLDEIKQSEDSTTLMRMYAKVPVQMKIDNMVIETIKGNPRDVRVVIRLTRVLTATIYGDKVEYTRTMNDALSQHIYINKILKEGGDNKQVQALATMIGIDAPAIQAMMDEMQSPLYIGVDEGDTINGKIGEVLAPDIYRVDTEYGSSIIVMPYGVECLNSKKKLDMFRMTDMEESALLTETFGSIISELNSEFERIFGLGADSGKRTDKDADVTITVIKKGPIFILDKDMVRQSDVLIHYSIITHNVIGDVGNTLLSAGQGFESPMYDDRLVPPDYNKFRSNAISVGKEIANLQIYGRSATPEICSRALVRIREGKTPWEMRAALRKKTAVPSKSTSRSRTQGYDATVVSVSNTGNITVRKSSDNTEVTLVFQCLVLPTYGTGDYYYTEMMTFLNGKLHSGAPVWVEEVPLFPDDVVPPGVTRAIIYIRHNRTGTNSSMNAYMLQEGYASFINHRGSEQYAEDWFLFAKKASRSRKGIWKFKKSSL